MGMGGSEKKVVSDGQIDRHQQTDKRGGTDRKTDGGGGGGGVGRWWRETERDRKKTQCHDSLLLGLMTKMYTSTRTTMATMMITAMTVPAMVPPSALEAAVAEGHRGKAEK